MNAVEYYDFTNANSNFKSLYHLINQYPDSVGIELGVYRAISFCSLLDCCPYIKKLYGVDNWLPHTDEKYVEEGIEIDIKDIKISKQIALHNITYCTNRAKAVIFEKTTEEVCNNFDDNFFDFVLIDSYMNEQTVKEEIERWYPKVKKGGIFAGHDWDTPSVQNVIKPYFDKNGYQLSVYDNVWMCIK